MRPANYFWILLAVSVSLNLVLAFALSDLLQTSASIVESKSKLKTTETEAAFQDFETVAFAREFAERFTSFESESFRSTQTALSFLLDEVDRAKRLEEVERIGEKLQKKAVTQRGRIVRLARKSEADDSFQADINVDLIEGSGATQIKSQFALKLVFDVVRVDRTAQNPWGFLIRKLRQTVIPDVGIHKTGLNSRTHSILILPGSPVLLRFPCVIENVELPKGTPIRVRLTTLDVSELQMRTGEMLSGEHKMRAVCRDRAFNVFLHSDKKTQTEDYPLTSLQSFSISQSNAAAMPARSRRETKSAVEKSIEEQLGFIIEAE